MENEIIKSFYNELINDAIDKINSNIEDSLYKNFFKEYKTKARRMSNSQCYDIYMGVYIPFTVKNGRGMENVSCLFNTLEDWFRIDHAVKRVEYLKSIEPVNKYINRMVM